MSYLEYHRIIIAFALVAARIGAAFLICPALSDSMVMGTARRVAIIAFSALAVPMALKGLPPGEPSLWPLVLVAVKEVFIGCVVGFFASIPFWVAENVGNFIDNQRGATMGEVYSPLSGTQVSTLGIFFTQIVSTAFFVSGAFLLFLSALYASYDVWPLFGPFVGLASNAPVQILGTLDEMLKTTVVISAPPVILMFLATLGLGFVNRTAPQLNVFFLSMPVKSALGIGLLVVYLPFIMDMLMYTREGAVLGPAIKLLQTN